MNPLMTQSWLDLAFLHWAADPADVAPLLPDGTVPDTLDGVTYVGLVAFRMHRIGWFRLPGIPYLGTFPETNVRLYSRDAHGRRGVVFRSLDASRLIPVAVARTVFRLPYVWSRMTVRRDADTFTYTSSRMSPRAPGRPQPDRPARRLHASRRPAGWSTSSPRAGACTAPCAGARCTFPTHTPAGPCTARDSWSATRAW